MEKKGPDLEKDACTCPICMYIMVEPVTMPCQHTLCMYCFNQTVAQTSFLCPICRQRISVWARRTAKKGGQSSLVDKKKWQAIQEAFPKKVLRRTEAIAKLKADGGGGIGDVVAEDDDDSDDDLDCETRLRKLRELSKPGEIGEEYAAAMEQLRQQKEAERRREEEASAALIRALQEEEGKELERLRTEREEMERLGKATAEQLQDESFEELQKRRVESSASKMPRPLSSTKTSHPRSSARRVASSNSGKPGQRSKSALDGKMHTMNNFFSPVPRTPSAPTVASHLGKVGQGKELSPYPFACYSPQDKIFYGLSSLGESASTPRPRPNSEDTDSSNEAPGLVYEHSYSTSSARVINLTSPSTAEEMCRERTDIHTYDLAKVKCEPEDIFAPGPSGLNKFHQQHQTSPQPSHSGSFQPICAYPNTPPKNSGQRTVPLTLPPFALSNKSDGSLDEEIASPKLKQKSINGIGKSSASAAFKKSLVLSVNAPSAGPGSSNSVGQGSGRADKDIPESGGSEINSNASRSSSSSSLHLDNVSDTVGVLGESTWGFHQKVSEEKTLQTNKRNENCATEMTKKHSEDCAVEIIDCEEDSNDVSSAENADEGSSLPTVDTATGRCRRKGILSLKQPTVGPYGDSHSGMSDTKPTATSTGVKTRKKVFTSKKRTSKKSTSNGVRREVKSSSGVNSAVTLDSYVERRKRTFSSVSVSGAEDDSCMTQEEKDRAFALKLQEHFNVLDKSGVVVDRFKGSKNEYSFRSKRQKKRPI